MCNFLSGAISKFSNMFSFLCLTTFSFELRDLASILLGKVPSHWCLQGILAVFSTVLLFVSPLDGWAQEKISMKVAWRKFDDICNSLVLSDRKEIVQLLSNSTSQIHRKFCKVLTFQRPIMTSLACSFTNQIKRFTIG